MSESTSRAMGSIGSSEIRELASNIRRHALEQGAIAGIDLTEAAILLLCVAVEGRIGKGAQMTIGTPGQFATMLRRVADRLEKDC